MKLPITFLALCYFSYCYAILQQLTLHTDWDCSGDGLILQSKQPDLLPEAPRIVSNPKSHSRSGYWILFQNANYTGKSFLTGGWESVECYNGSMYDEIYNGSARYLGPPDTTTHSISFYEEALLSGRDFTITEPSSLNLPFIPNSLITTQNTSWTLYDGVNFTGTATCFVPNPEDWWDSLGIANLSTKSVLRGCDQHIDHYLYGGSHDFQLL